MFQRPLPRGILWSHWCLLFCVDANTSVVFHRPDAVCGSKAWMPYQSVIVNLSSVIISYVIGLVDVLVGLRADRRRCEVSSGPGPPQQHHEPLQEGQRLDDVTFRKRCAASAKTAVACAAAVL